ncbi:hypothetical protein [Clostridium perfringens]|uniref:hypothetical protein n=1 Tax=Clostridium perfringens TaxID=1502 RepID=UPI0024BD595B|nr:hypothetical protein [Clostridium perfringens]
MALNRGKKKKESRSSDKKLFGRKQETKKKKRIIEEENQDIEYEEDYVDDGTTEFTDFITGNLERTDEVVDDEYVKATMKGLESNRIRRVMPIIEVDYTQELRQASELMRSLQRRNRRSNDDDIIDSNSPSKFDIV